VIAVKAGGRGVLTDSGLAWRSEDREVSSDVATPLLYQDRFYILHGTRKVLSCVEPATGRVVWKGSLDGAAIFEASPTAADGKIYVANHRGEVFVVAAGDTFRLLHRAAMGGERDQSVRSAVAIADGRLFVRTDTRLYCIGGGDR
jgi:outer membrane protein assembly factor BamB